MSKFEVVCTEESMSGFFDEYLTNLGKPEAAYDNLIISLNWKKLLFKDAYLILDMTEDRYEELVKTDSMFLFLEKSSQGGGSKIMASPGILDEYEKEGSFGEFLSPIFIGESLKKAHELKYGRLIFPQSEMQNVGKLIFNHSNYIIRGKNEKRDSLSSWNDLESVSLPFSEIVFIDNYILKDGGIFNIINLIKALMPKKQKKNKIMFTIISLFEDSQSVIEKKTDQWYHKLNRALKTTFSQFSFDLSIAVISRKGLNHDRALLTNYLWIDSGHGFNCFNNNGNPKVTTTIKYVPIFSNSGGPKSSASSYDCWMTMRDHARKLVQSSAYIKGTIENNSLLK